MALTKEEASLLASTIRALFHIENIRREQAYCAKIMRQDIKRELSLAVEYNQKVLDKIFGLMSAKEGAGRRYIAASDEKLASIANIMELLQALDEEHCALIETELKKEVTVSYEPAA